MQKLDQATDRFSQRDKAIFARIVDAYTKHDTARANVFANELAEVRKMERLIINARLALEQIVLRLRTVSELGDVVSTLGPAVGVLRSVRAGLSQRIPRSRKRTRRNRQHAKRNNDRSRPRLRNDTELRHRKRGRKQRFSTKPQQLQSRRIKEKFPDLPPGMPRIASIANREINPRILKGV